jgi:hypothetical protein
MKKFNVLGLLNFALKYAPVMIVIAKALSMIREAIEEIHEKDAKKNTPAVAPPAAAHLEPEKEITA